MWIWIAAAAAFAFMVALGKRGSIRIKVVNERDQQVGIVTDAIVEALEDPLFSDRNVRRMSRADVEVAVLNAAMLRRNPGLSLDDLYRDVDEYIILAVTCRILKFRDAQTRKNEFSQKPDELRRSAPVELFFEKLEELATESAKVEQTLKKAEADVLSLCAAAQALGFDVNGRYHEYLIGYGEVVAG